MKAKIRRILLAFTAARRNETLVSYSQEGEDMILAELFRQKSTGFYVDVGAFHPTRFSNTKYFYKKGWSGINIEPSPSAMREFLKNRRRDTNLNLGVSDKSGTLEFYTFAEPALNTFQKDRVEFLENTTPYRSNGQISVPVERLDKILEKFSSNREIDFMNIDVEAHEKQVLQSNDWEKFRPEVLLVEILDFSLETILKNPVHIFLVKKGYRFECKTPRTCFYLNEKR
jgi:FkbM family methyltransferase